ncbi:hypothetical protein B296_00044898 [Ensete ventricosum]|uniref:CASP-like protein n=1 Tax=Ensete ventricosum TaxID=4639 RepID=A0A426Y0S6_ENSVE|nr:hypothetical protein B296_00044898 [Ensete ventricosum]
MASTEMSPSANGSRKTAAESAHVLLPPAPGLLGVDLSPRLLLFATAVSALGSHLLVPHHHHDGFLLCRLSIDKDGVPSRPLRRGDLRASLLLPLYYYLLRNYTGLKGNSLVNRSKVCNVYGKFCGHIGSSIAVSVVASILLVSTTPSAVVADHLMNTTHSTHCRRVCTAANMRCA